MNRYFIVVYNFADELNYGSVTSKYVTINNEYVNLKKFTNSVIKFHSKNTQITITNIIELSESDYNDFVEE